MSDEPRPSWDVFQDTLDSAIAWILRVISHEELSKAVPHLFNQRRHIDDLEEKCAITQDFFNKHARRDLTDLFEQMEVEKSFKLLDYVLEAARARRARYERAIAEKRDPDPCDLPIDFENLNPQQILACTVAAQVDERLGNVYKATQAAEQKIKQADEEIKKLEEELVELDDKIKGTCSRMQKFRAD